MKTRSLLQISSLFLLTTSFALSALADGVGAGGGGAQIEAAFRLKGYELIQQIGKDPDAGAYCSASTLQGALDTTKIDVVPELTDPANGKPITQILDAWTVPHYIQLLDDSWENLVGLHSHPYRKNESVQILILHEIYRATGSCDDNNFKISEKVWALLTGHGYSTYSETFTFPYPTTRYAGACDQPFAAMQKGAKANCVLFDFSNDSDFTLLKNVPFADQEYFNAQNCSGLENFDFKASIGLSQYDFANQLAAVNPEHPLFLLHDFQSGTWTFEIE